MQFGFFLMQANFCYLIINKNPISQYNEKCLFRYQVLILRKLLIISTIFFLIALAEMGFHSFQLCSTSQKNTPFLINISLFNITGK